MTQAPEVLLIANNFPPLRGGSAVVYANLAKFAQGRIEVLAAAATYADGLPMIGWREHDRLAPFPISRVPLLRTVMVPYSGPAGRLRLWLDDLVIRARLLGRVLALLRPGRPRAVCIGELLASGWLLRLLRFVPGLRGTVYVHGEEITTADAYDPQSVRRRAGLLAAERIFVVSRFSMRAVRELLGPQADERLVLIENGVDLTRFRPAAREPELVARYGLAGRFTFISVCRLLEKKGVDHAIQAFARLLRTDPDAIYVVVGTGPYQAELVAMADSLGIAGSVRFAGSVEEHELAGHYRLGDVFIMPNRALPNGDTEGFGLVFLEANACGLPVIAGRDGGSTDAVQDGVNGLVVDGGSVEAIHAAMLRLRQDEALRDRLATQGLATAAAADWTSRAECFLRSCGGG